MLVGIADDCYCASSALAGEAESVRGKAGVFVFLASQELILSDWLNELHNRLGQAGLILGMLVWLLMASWPA